MAKTRSPRPAGPAPEKATRRLPERASKHRGRTAGAAGATTPRASRRNPGRVARSAPVSRLDDCTSDGDGPSSDEAEQSDDSPLPTPRRRLRRDVPSPSPDPLALSSPATRSRPRTDISVDSDADELTSNAYLSPSNTDAERSRLQSTARSTRGGKSRGRQVIVETAQHGIATLEDETTDAEMPNWTSLPYHVWLPIFQFAFAGMDHAAGINWIHATSRKCPPIAEAALAALYECPPLLTRAMAHKLADLLAQDPSTTAFNYRQKITKLRINVEQIVAKTYKGKHLDLKSLVANVPRLRVLDFYHPKDAAPFRQLDDGLRWAYPHALFEALGVPGPDVDGVGKGDMIATPSVARLAGWRWNRRLMGPAQDLTFIRQLHQTQAFSRLKKLSLVNYQLPTLLENNIEEAVATAKDEAYLQQVADAILALPNLDFLSIESSTIVNGYLLPLLPRNLKNITLINCWDVQADELSTFLLSHGSQVEHLTLHHNQSLSLAFVKTLGTACPRLKSLDMDFKYYNHHEFYHDGRPAYDHVLQEGDTPDWPSGIESIELRNARKWAPEAAEMLFRSLVDNATRFTKLRHLALKVMLDIPFRQRSEIREKWESKMKQVFLRRSADPMPFHSLRPSGEASAPKCRSKKRKSRDFSVPGQETRRSPRFKDMDNAGLASRASSCGRGRRLSARSRPSYVEPETDDDTDMEDAADADSSRQSSVSAGAAARSSNDGQEVVIQGLCDVVEVHIDNQKQTETVWAMSDFLDAESDDPTDSEWNGDQEAEESYAW